MTPTVATPSHGIAHASRTKGIAIGGLAIGAVLGFGGNFAAPGPVQDLLYAVSAVGLIVAATLLAVEHAAMGRQHTAAGFALLALGETRLLNPTDAPGGDASSARQPRSPSLRTRWPTSAEDPWTPPAH